jgi:hypothetical protein
MQSLFLMDDLRIIKEISRGHVCGAGPYSTPAASGSIRQSTKKTIPVKADLGRHAAEEHAAWREVLGIDET